MATELRGLTHIDQELPDLGNERRQLVLDGLPDDIGINRIVAVSNDIAKIDDAAVIGDPLNDIAIEDFEPPQASPRISNCRSTADRNMRSLS